jgi:hypothetical protein
MQNMMMQQMMQMMNNMQQGNQQPQQAPAAGGATPQTRAEVQAMIDALDMRFANGEISESAYNKLVEKWQQKLDSMS